MVAVTSTACTGSLAPPVCATAAPADRRRRSPRHSRGRSTGELDVLFVVDDTDAVAPWADTCARDTRRWPARSKMCRTAFPTFTSGSCARRAARRRRPARDCGVATPDAFLRHETCGRISNFSGSFVDTFACLADLGTQACAPRAAVRGGARRLCAAAARGLGGLPAPRRGVAGRLHRGSGPRVRCRRRRAGRVGARPEARPHRHHGTVMAPGDCPPSRNRRPA